ncbi:MAG: ribbon-helix-helix protein, CopG family [Acidobacteriota bacterium]|jgi:predicted transcriptional regulator
MTRQRKQRRRIPDEERKKNLIAVRVKDDEMEALEKIADRENLPVSYFVRQGIRLVIEKRLKP